MESLSMSEISAKISEKNTNGMLRGVVSKIDRIQNGSPGSYGFIACSDGNDRFFRWSNMSKDSVRPFHHLSIGDVVTFKPVEVNGKLQADEVIFIPKNQVSVASKL